MHDQKMCVRNAFVCACTFKKTHYYATTSISKNDPVAFTLEKKLRAHVSSKSENCNNTVLKKIFLTIKVEYDSQLMCSHYQLFKCFFGLQIL